MKKNELTNKWGIYKITNICNNKFYIGSSNNLRKRLADHKRELRLNKHTNTHLQNAYNKYGVDSFKYDIIFIIEDTENLNNEYLRNLETEYIQNLECYKSEIGYNFIAGGIGTLNTPCSEEKKKKISDSNKDKVAWNKGIAMSDEQKQLLKEVNRSKRGKSVDIYSTLGEFIETMDSINAVVEKYKISKNTITDSCKGRRTPKSYIFKYHDNFISCDNKYTKNSTTGETKFCIYDLNNILLCECKYKKDVVLYLTNSTKRNGNIERKLKDIQEDSSKTVCLYNKYIIKFNNALTISDNSNVLRQPVLDENGGNILNIANGEA